MGKPRKVKKRYQYDRSRRREWKRKEKKSNVGCDQMKEVWDETKTLSQNIREMGLTLDPNKALPLRKTRDAIGPQTSQSLEATQDFPKPPKSHIIAKLESEADAPQPQRMHLSEPEVRYCTYMLDKYGDDYKAMCRDHRNYYQETPKQIKRKIEQFKKIDVQYNAYLESKKGNTETMVT